MHKWEKQRYTVEDLHGPGGPAGRAGTGRAEAGRAHKPTKWNGPGRAFSSNGGPGGASRADTGQFS